MRGLLCMFVVSSLAHAKTTSLHDRKAYTMQQHVDNPYPTCKHQMKPSPLSMFYVACCTPIFSHLLGLELAMRDQIDAHARANPRLYRAKKRAGPHRKRYITTNWSLFAFSSFKGKPGDCEDTWGLFNKVFADLWLNGADNQTCVALLILRCEVTPILFILKTLRCL